MNLYTRSIRYTNLDIAVGASINGLFFAKIYHLKPLPDLIVLLFTSVWIIYTLDRILDANNEGADLFERHKFHKRYSKVLLYIILSFLLVTLFLLPGVDGAVLIHGGILSLLILLYLFMVWKKVPFPKEIFVAVFYTMGVSIIALSYYTFTSAVDWVPIIQHVLLSFSNLLIISWFELKNGREPNKNKLIFFLTSRVRGCLLFLLIIHFSLGVYSLVLGYFLGVQLIFLMMYGVFLTVLLFPDWFKIDSRYGIWLDAAFFLPALYLL